MLVVNKAGRALTLSSSSGMPQTAKSDLDLL